MSSAPSIAQAIASHRFSRGLPENECKALAECAIEVRFPAGDFLLKQNDRAERFFLLLDGQVLLTSHVPQQGEMAVETLSGGDVLGWSWLIPPYHWHFDARAQSPVTALALDAGRVRRLMEADHDLGYELMKRFLDVVVHRLQANRMQMLDVFAKPGSACL